MVLSSRPRSARSCEQCRHALVHLRQLAAHGLEVLLVGVPAAVVIDGDVGDAALHQPPRHQARLAEGVAAVAVAQLVLLLREVEDLAGVAEDQFVGLLLGFLGGDDLRIAGHRVRQGVELVQILAAVLLALVGDALRHDAFHGEARLRRVAAGGEGLVARAQEAGLGEASLRLGQHDVRRDQSLVAGVVALEQRDHRAHAGVDLAAAGDCARSAPCRTRSRGR